MRHFVSLNITFILLIFYLPCSAIEIRLAYSDLIPNSFRELIYENVVSLDKDLEADITNLSAFKSGSLPILEDFLSNRVDICILAYPENNEFSVLDNDQIISIPFAYKSSVVVVNSENPISEITIKQLSSIFGEFGYNSNFLSWRDLGLSTFSTSIIKAYSVKEDNGISSDLFRYSVLNEKSFNSSVNFGVKESLEQMIIQDKAAIGVFPSDPRNPNLKVLFLAQDDESIAYGPSIDNLYYHDYPIRLPFYIVYNIKDAEKLFPLVNILLGDLAASLLEKNDFFPIPKVIREKLIIDLKMDMQQGN